jgi:hypothetical protein
MSALTTRKKHWLRHLCFSIASFTAPLVAAYLAIEIHLAIYLHKTGETRAQQSENYGLGFEALLLAAVTAIVVFVLTIFLWWFSGRKLREITNFQDQ